MTYEIGQAPAPCGAECGVDAVDVAAFRRLVARRGQTFIRRAFTPDEVEVCGDRIDRLAARFAAKEAVAKALGTGIGPIRLRDVEVRSADDHRPMLTLHGKAAERAEKLGLTGWSLSLTHANGTAIALVIGYPGDDAA